MADPIKATFVNPLDYPDCTSYVLTDLTVDPATLPIQYSVGGGALTVKISKNNGLALPAYQVKIWDAHGTEPGDITAQRTIKLLSLLKKNTAKQVAASVKKAAAKKTAAKKKR
jgi:hypothetical protein